MLGHWASFALLAIPTAHVPHWQDTLPLAETRRLLSALESVRPIPPTLVLEIDDRRRFQQDTIPSTMFGALLRDSLSNRGVSLVEALGEGSQPAQHTALQGKVVLGFLGAFRTGAGRRLARASIDVEVAKQGPQGALNSRIVALEFPLERFSQATDWHQALAAQVASKAVDSLLAGIRAMAADLYEVTALGVAPGGELTERVRENAVRDGLAQAAARVWGVSVESATTVLDLSDVSTRTETRTHGAILSFKVHEEMSRLTNDGFLVVVLTAVVGRKGT